MDLTVFDLLLVFKNTEMPFILTYGDTFEKYTYRELAMDNEKTALNVAGVRVETIDGRPSYLIKIRG